MMSPQMMMKMMQKQGAMMPQQEYKHPENGTEWVLTHLDGMASYAQASMQIKRPNLTEMLNRRPKVAQMAVEPSDVIDSNSFAAVEVEKQEALAKAS